LCRFLQQNSSISPHIFLTYFLADSWSEWSKIVFKDAFLLSALTIYDMITKFFDEIGILQRFWPNFEAT
jgi:hypothetical protein